MTTCVQCEEPIGEREGYYVDWFYDEEGTVVVSATCVRCASPELKAQAEAQDLAEIRRKEEP